MLEATEWITVEGLVELLQPFCQVANVLSGLCFPIISVVKLLLHILLNAALKVKDAQGYQHGQGSHCQGAGQDVPGAP
jgi:hypothetical protein